MGKPYDHDFMFKGSGTRVGDMVCETCRKPILDRSQDWMYYKRSKAHDWRFHCYHRKCYRGSDGWAVIEAKNAKAKRRYDAIVADLRSVAEKHNVTDAHSFAEAAAYTLGADLHQYYS